MIYEGSLIFDKFNYLLSQQYDIPLSQQIEIKDQLQAPLAEIEIDDLQPEYFRFLELWHKTYPDDIHQYNPSYYSSLLQEKLNSFLSRYKLLKKLPNEHFELLDLFHKSENDLSFADYLYRKIFNIHA